MNWGIKYLSTLLLAAACSCAGNAQDSLFNPQDLKLISSQFAFTEGPAVNKKGEIFFTDQPNDKIWKYGTDGLLTVFLDKTGRSNGLYFDKKGNLLACADEANELWSINQKGKVKILLSNFEGKKLNGPNDLWVDKNGSIYFTDPYYQRDYWKRKQPEIKEQNVYYLPTGKHSNIKIVADDLKKPNGIVGTPDGKYLYVADIGAGKTYKYTITANGSLQDKTLLINQGSDGMTLDSLGNIYLTGKGVTIYNLQGTQIGHIEIDGWTANVCFGGKNRTDLFITSGKSVYIMPMNVKGVE